MIGGEGPANAAWMVAGTWLKVKFLKIFFIILLFL
jgi:hypothetical protein